MTVNWLDPPHEPSWNLYDPPEPKEYAKCLHCTREVYSREPVYRVADGVIHEEDCFAEYAKDALNATYEHAGEYDLDWRDDENE